MYIIVHFSKMDQYQHGNQVLVVKLDLSTCPVTMLVKYYEVAHLSIRFLSQIIPWYTQLNDQIKEK